MNSILLIIKSNLARRRSQSITAGVSIVTVSLLFSLSIGILTSIQQPFDKVFNNLNASHILLLYDFRNDNGDSMKNWFLKQPEVESVGNPDAYYNCNGPLFVKTGKIDALVQITEFTSNHLRQDKLKILKGDIKDAPGINEIWLPNYLAVQHNIQVGDTIAIPTSGGTYSFKVSAMVSDPHYGSGMVNPTRAWVKAGSLSFFAPVSQLTNNCLGIRLKSTDLVADVLGRFNTKFNFAGTALQYSIFKSAFMSTYQLIAGILLIFSILALIIAVYLIRSIIIKTIYDYYKLTGILKAQGFTPANIIVIYVTQYLFMAILFIALGCCGTSFILQLIMQSVMRTIGVIDLHLRLPFIFAVSFIFLTTIIVLTAFIAALKTTKIKPAQAIKYGAPERIKTRTRADNIINRSLLPLLPALSIRALMENKKRALVTFTVLLFTIFILLFSSGVTTSLSQLKYNKAAWGFENGEIELVRNGATPIGFTHQELKEIFEGEKGIKSVTPFSYESIMILPGAGKQPVNLFGKAYEGDITKAGLITLSGIYPSNESEIALCIGTAKLLGKMPGDSIAAFIEGQQVTLKITGVYQDISNMGQGFRLSSKTFEKLNPVYSPAMYSLKLVNVAGAEDYKKYLQKKYGSTITINMNIEDRLKQMGIVSNMIITFLLLAIFFITILLLSIWNDVIVSTRDYRKSFGIFKTAGFTPRQLRMLLVWKMILLCAFSLILAIPLSLFLSPLLMGQVTQNFGIVQFPFSVSGVSVIIIACIFFCAVVLCAWLSSSGASKINPRVLLVGQ